MESSEIDTDISSDSGEFLTFILGEEEYGVDILAVQGIQGWNGVTRIPNAPNHMLGVINLRGAIVPIIDMRIKFNLANTGFDSTTVVIVVRAEQNGQEHVIGLVVDAVSEVYKVNQDDIQKNPEFDSENTNDLVKGLITIDKKMVIVLDVDLLVLDWTPDTLALEDVA